MRDFSSFQSFTISENQAAAIEGGVDATTTTSSTTSTTVPAIPITTTAVTELKKAKHDKIAQFQSKIAEVKSSTKFHAVQKIKLTEVFTKHVMKLKA